MTSLVEGAKRLVGKGSDVDTRIEGLRLAAEAARGRLDDDLVDDAAATAERAASRLSLSGGHTVVARGEGYVEAADLCVLFGLLNEDEIHLIVAGDPYDTRSPYHRWTARFSAGATASAGPHRPDSPPTRTPRAGSRPEPRTRHARRARERPSSR